jgi:hypothetical protein
MAVHRKIGVLLADVGSYWITLSPTERQTVLERVLAYTRAVPPPPGVETDCRLWTRSLLKGYGQIRFRSRMGSTHRLVFLLVHGYLPPVVMHSCDRPACQEPDHLRAGTPRLNTLDAMAKGRMRHAHGRWQPLSAA